LEVRERSVQVEAKPHGGGVKCTSWRRGTAEALVLLSLSAAAVPRITERRCLPMRRAVPHQTDDP